LAPDLLLPIIENINQLCNYWTPKSSGKLVAAAFTLILNISTVFSLLFATYSQKFPPLKMRSYTINHLYKSSFCTVCIGFLKDKAQQ
jgi:hypothetical protein